MDYFKTLDISFLLYINQRLANPSFDFVMLNLSDRFLWSLIGTLFVIAAIMSKKTHLISCVIALTLGIIVADVVCFELLKPFFYRLRPCHNIEIAVRTIDGCGGMLGMPSNHSANGMTIAFIGWYYLGRNWGLFMVAAAVLVGGSRIYLGVHYPSDVLAGFLLGPLFAGLGIMVTKWILKTRYGRALLKFAR